VSGLPERDGPLQYDEERRRVVIEESFSVTVQNPEVLDELRDLGRELNARPWEPVSKFRNPPFGTGRPLNRAGRRAQRRQK